ncbi:hypothetical protein GLA29479_4434 [Lysobacter antibioticus]|nr:hypothetical protein GLA29479_4434 [Lysobacter antibioticus]
MPRCGHACARLRGFRRPCTLAVCIQTKSARASATKLATHLDDDESRDRIAYGEIASVLLEMC